MIRIDVDYTDYRDDSDPNYPGGKAIDAPSEDSPEGTPYKADWMNDINGFRQAVFNKAFGSMNEISGNPDNAFDSDTLLGIEKLIANDVADEAALRIQGDNNTLTSAKNYTVEQVAAEAALRVQGDSSTLASAKSYAVEQIAIETQNRIQADATNLTAAKKYFDDILKDKIYYVGKSYIQRVNEKTPNDAGLPGQWELWNERAEIYEIIPNSVYATLFSTLPTSWTVESSIAANQYRIWTPMGITTLGTRRIIRSNKQVNGTPKEMNPIDWDDIANLTRVERKTLQASWTDPDLIIGGTVTYNSTQYRIVGIITPSGLYEAFAGGNRPTFIQEGTAGDFSRLIWGSLERMSSTTVPLGSTTSVVLGAFCLGRNMGNTAIPTASSSNYASSTLDINSGLVVPTKNEFSPRTISAQIWRRVA